MADAFDIGQVQAQQGGQYQAVDAGIRQPGQSTSMDQFVQAVGVFAPAVRRYAVDKQTEISTEQTHQVLANLHEQEQKGIQDAASLVKDGKLALGANPYAAKAARNLFMQGIAKRMGDQIAADYENSPVRNDTPEAVARWTRDEFAKRAQAQGFTDPHDMQFIEGFVPTQERMVEGLVGYHTKIAAQRTERDLKEGISQNAGDVASHNLLMPDVAAREIGNTTLKIALMTGMAPRDANENVLDGLLNKALSSGDTSYLDVAEQVPTLNDRAEEVPLGSRNWAVEKIARARAAIESSNASHAASAAKQEKLAKEQNKDAFLAEGADIIFSGKDALANTGPKFDALIQKGTAMALKGDLDPETIPKLRKMRDDEIESNLKASERGEPIGQYGAQAHNVASQMIFRGEVKTFDQLVSLYSPPAMAPYRKEAFKAYSDYTKAQEIEASSGISGLRLGFVTSDEFKSLSATNPAAARNAEIYMNSALIDFKAKNPDADAMKITEAYGTILKSVRENYLGSGKDGNGADKKKLLTYGEQIVSQVESIKDVNTQAKTYNSVVVDKATKQAETLVGLDSYLKERDIDPNSERGYGIKVFQATRLRHLAEASRDPDALESSKAINAIIVNSTLAAQSKPDATTPATMNSDAFTTDTKGDKQRYIRVPPIDPGSLQILMDANVVKRIANVFDVSNGNEDTYVLTDADKAIKALADHTVSLIKATRRDVKPDPVVK